MLLLEGFLGRPLGPVLKSCLPLMKNVLRPLAKNILILLGLTAVALATDEAIQKKKICIGDYTDNFKRRKR